MLKTLLTILLMTTATLSAELKNGVVYAELHDEISFESVLEVKAGLALAEMNKLPLLIDIDSPGGSVIAQIDITSAIRSSNVKVHTHVSGLAASAASVILASGAIRTAVPGAVILTHYASRGGGGSMTQADAEAEVNELKAINMSLENELMAFTHHTREEVQKLFLHLHENVILPTNIAIEDNLIDGISEKPLQDYIPAVKTVIPPKRSAMEI